MQPHFHPHPHHTSCNMTSAETMTSPVMTSGTTIANHYGLHHNTSSALPPHHPHYPNQRTFVRHHIGKKIILLECIEGFKITQYSYAVRSNNNVYSFKAAQR